MYLHFLLTAAVVVLAITVIKAINYQSQAKILRYDFPTFVENASFKCMREGISPLTGAAGYIVDLELPQYIDSHGDAVSVVFINKPQLKPGDRLPIYLGREGALGVTARLYESIHKKALQYTILATVSMLVSTYIGMML